MNNTVTFEVEISADLADALQDYLAMNRNRDQDQVMSAGLALFLLQNGAGDRRTSRIYLDSLFNPAA